MRLLVLFGTENKSKRKENQNLTQIKPLNEKHAIQVFPGKALNKQITLHKYSSSSHRKEFQKTIELLTFNSKGMCQIFGTSWRVSTFDNCRYKSVF